MKKGSISLRCALMGMARSTYYEYEGRVANRHARDQKTVERLRVLAETKKFKLGIKTLTMAYYRTHTEPINHKKVARLKREYNIPTKIRTRRYTKPQQPKPTLRMIIPENIINRQFKVDMPHRCAGTDVTYLWIQRQQRFAYLSNVRDMAFTSSSHSSRSAFDKNNRIDFRWIIVTIS